MSKRSSEKRITGECRALRFLREQAKLSFRQAERASGLNLAIINHLENGRMAVHQRHLEKLLPSYGATIQMFEILARGTAAIPRDLRRECIELVRSMPDEQLDASFTVLKSFSSLGKVK
jgi:transcriptional regulator with XRE-family HTH domain